MIDVGIGAAVGALASAQQANKQRKFSLMMSSTAHQREVADLRAAGLNPILSATGGRGAVGGAPPVPDPGKGLGQAASAMASLRLQKKLQTAQVGKLEAETASIKAVTHKRELVGRGYEYAGKAADLVEDFFKEPSIGQDVVGATGRSMKEHSAFTRSWNAKKRLRAMHYGINPFVIERKGRKTPEQLEALSHREVPTPGKKQMPAYTKPKYPKPKIKPGESRTMYLSRVKAWGMLMREIEKRGDRVKRRK